MLRVGFRQLAQDTVLFLLHQVLHAVINGFCFQLLAYCVSQQPLHVAQCERADLELCTASA